jgi:hypothetical protein
VRSASSHLLPGSQLTKPRSGTLICELQAGKKAKNIPNKIVISKIFGTNLISLNIVFLFLINVKESELFTDR